MLLCWVLLFALLSAILTAIHSLSFRHVSPIATCYIVCHMLFILGHYIVFSSQLIMKWNH